MIIIWLLLIFINFNGVLCAVPCRRPRLILSILKCFSYWGTTRDRSAKTSSKLISKGLPVSYGYFLLSHSFRRAVKCYQKVLDLQPVNTEAAICLGDVLTAIGEEVSCFFLVMWCTVERLCKDTSLITVLSKYEDTSLIRTFFSYPKGVCNKGVPLYEKNFLFS